MDTTHLILLNTTLYMYKYCGVILDTLDEYFNNSYCVKLFTFNEKISIYTKNIYRINKKRAWKDNIICTNYYILININLI